MLTAIWFPSVFKRPRYLTALSVPQRGLGARGLLFYHVSDRPLLKKTAPTSAKHLPNIHQYIPALAMLSEHKQHERDEGQSKAYGETAGRWQERCACRGLCTRSLPIPQLPAMGAMSQVFRTAMRALEERLVANQCPVSLAGWMRWDVTEARCLPSLPPLPESHFCCFCLAT